MCVIPATLPAQLVLESMGKSGLPFRCAAALRGRAMLATDEGHVAPGEEFDTQMGD